MCHYYSSDATTDAKKAREREQKWLKMIGNWKDWSDNKSSRVSFSIILVFGFSAIT